MWLQFCLLFSSFSTICCFYIFLIQSSLDLKFNVHVSHHVIYTYVKFQIFFENL
jgi:hypothetical protein